MRLTIMVVLAAAGFTGAAGAQERAAAEREKDAMTAEKVVGALVMYAPEALKQAKCPVGDKPIDPQQAAKFRGKRVFFCSAACRKAFEADPFEYADALRAQWDVLKPLRAQVTCPVTGKPFDRKQVVETPLVDVYFASAAAKAQFEKHPERYVEKLPAAFTFQTTCGTCDTPIKPSVHCEHDGKTYYFCCPGCMGMFEKRAGMFVGEVKKEVTANEAAVKQAERAQQDEQREEKEG